MKRPRNKRSESLKSLIRTKKEQLKETNKPFVKALLSMLETMVDQSNSMVEKSKDLSQKVSESVLMSLELIDQVKSSSINYFKKNYKPYLGQYHALLRKEYDHLKQTLSSFEELIPKINDYSALLEKLKLKVKEKKAGEFEHFDPWENEPIPDLKEWLGPNFDASAEEFVPEISPEKFNPNVFDFIPACKLLFKTQGHQVKKFNPEVSEFIPEFG